MLGYKNGNDCKFFHSSTKLITSDSEIHETLKSVHQDFMTKMKIYTSEGCIVSNVSTLGLNISVIENTRNNCQNNSN